MQAVQYEVQAYHRVWSDLSQRMDAAGEPSQISSSLPEVWLLKLQASLPMGSDTRYLQLTHTSRAQSRLRPRIINQQWFWFSEATKGCRKNMTYDKN